MSRRLPDDVYLESRKWALQDRLDELLENPDPTPEERQEIEELFDVLPTFDQRIEEARQARLERETRLAEQLSQSTSQTTNDGDNENNDGNSDANQCTDPYCPVHNPGLFGSLFGGIADGNGDQNQNSGQNTTGAPMLQSLIQAMLGGPLANPNDQSAQAPAQTGEGDDQPPPLEPISSQTEDNLSITTGEGGQSSASNSSSLPPIQFSFQVLGPNGQVYSSDSNSASNANDPNPDNNDATDQEYADFIQAMRNFRQQLNQVSQDMQPEGNNSQSTGSTEPSESQNDSQADAQASAEERRRARQEMGLMLLTLGALSGGGGGGLGNGLSNAFLDILENGAGLNLPQNLEDVQVPLPEELIKQYPVASYSETDPEKSFPQCSICMMEFESDEPVKKLTCRHIYHPDCIDRWLGTNVHCPVCNKDLRELSGLSTTQKQHRPF